MRTTGWSGAERGRATRRVPGVLRCRGLDLSWLVAVGCLPWITLACGDDSPADPLDDEPADTVEAPTDTTGTPADTLPTPLAGGELTVFVTSPDAYNTIAPVIAGDGVEGHFVGGQFFRTRFVPAPAEIDFGLGPIFNEASCEACHVRASRTRGIRLLRVSEVGGGEHGAPRPLPGYGTQVQDKAIPGFSREARVEVAWETEAGTYPDGTPYELRSPSPQISAAHLPFDAPEWSFRTPRPVFGLGLLEGVSTATLDGLADPGDADADGVSGRPNMVWDIASASLRHGRFGWKAEQPSLLQQTDAAYLEDMGVTTSLYPTEATAGQPGGEDGLDDDPELADDQAEGVAFYVRTLGIPGRRDVNDSTVMAGAALFSSLGCASCHLPTLESEGDPVAGIGPQTIHPYTDLLLHDMGEGLSDGRPAFVAEGSEWRTPPLWGLGLADTVTLATEYLHDGRARSVEEAILWHGGEAGGSREAFRALAAGARAALLRFLASL